MRTLTCYTQYRGQCYKMAYSVPTTIIDEQVALAQATLRLRKHGMQLIGYDFNPTPRGVDELKLNTLNTEITLIASRPL